MQVRKRSDANIRPHKWSNFYLKEDYISNIICYVFIVIFNLFGWWYNIPISVCSSRLWMTHYYPLARCKRNLHRKIDKTDSR